MVNISIDKYMVIYIYIVIYSTLYTIYMVIYTILYLYINWWLDRRIVQLHNILSWHGLTRDLSAAASCVVLSRPSVKRHVPMAQSCSWWSGAAWSFGMFWHPKNELTKNIQILSSILPADWFFPPFVSFEKDVDTLRQGTPQEKWPNEHLFAR